MPVACRHGQNAEKLYYYRIDKVSKSYSVKVDVSSQKTFTQVKVNQAHHLRYLPLARIWLVVYTIMLAIDIIASLTWH